MIYYFRKGRLVHWRYAQTVKMAFECKGKVKTIVGKLEKCFMSEETSQKVSKQLSGTKVCFIDIHGRQSPLILLWRASFTPIYRDYHSCEAFKVYHFAIEISIGELEEFWLVIQLTVRIGLSQDLELLSMKIRCTSYKLMRWTYLWFETIKKLFTFPAILTKKDFRLLA